MLQKIYQNVFASEREMFDPEKNIYLVLVNFTGKAMLDSVASYVKNDGVEELLFELSDIDKPNYIGDRLYQNSQERYNTFYNNKRTHYVVMFEYEESDIGASIGKAVRQIVGCSFLGGRDTVVLLATVPEERQRSAKYLNRLGKEEGLQNVTAYFFVRERYNENALHSSLRGFFCLLSDQLLYSQLETNFSRTVQYVDAGEMGLPEEGRRELQQRPKLYWSTVFVFDQSDKMSFLRRYLDGLYGNCLKYEAVSCKEVCASFFRDIVDISNTQQAWIGRLEQAIRMIPRVSSVEPDHHQSFENYFSQLYGSEGMSIVELTMQINLQKRLLITKQIVHDAAVALIRHALEYYTRSLVEDVMKHIDDYIRIELSDNVKKARDGVRRFACEEADISMDMPEYIKRYVDYCDLLQQSVFWAEVKSYILSHAESFREESERAVELAERLDQARQDLHVPPRSTDAEYPSFCVNRLLAADTDGEIGKQIARAYETQLQDDRKREFRIPPTGSYSRLFPALPLFSAEYQYNPTHNFTDTVIYQRIGRYYMFQE